MIDAGESERNLQLELDGVNECEDGEAVIFAGSRESQLHRRGRMVPNYAGNLPGT